MKYIFVLFLFVFIYMVEAVNAQEKNDITQIRLSINANKKKLRDVLVEIEKKADVIFSYNSKKIKADSLVSINISNGKLDDIFKQLFSKNISYQISSNNVILFSKTNKPNKNAEGINQRNLVDSEKAKTANHTDTIWVYKKDTVILNRIDTIKIIVRDTVIKTQFITDSENKNKKIKPDFYLGLFYQFHKPTSDYQHFGVDAEDVNAKEIISSSEKIKSSQRTGLFISLISNHLMLGSGFSVLRVNESYSYSDSEDTMFLFNSEDTSYSVVGKNKYNHISIPFSIGYSFDFNTKLNAGMCISAWFNYLLSASGKFLDLGSDKPYQLKDIDMLSFNKFGIDFSLGITLGYNITDHFTLQLTPSYNLQIGSDYNKNYPITKHKKSFGINFSLLRKF